MSQKTLQNYIPALTGVRALAAYLVFISHYYNVFDDVFPHIVQRFLGELHIGVSIFFVLSGFLITFRYYNKFHLTADWFKQYLKNRVARIYPMYALLTIGAFVYYFITRDESITRGYQNPLCLLVLNLTFIRGFFYRFWDTGIAQGWSLTVEECFYLLAPLIFILIKRSRLNLLLLPVIFLTIGLALVQVCKGINFYGLMASNSFMYVFTFFGTAFEFFVGIGLALYFKKHSASVKNGYRTYGGIIIIAICTYLISVIRMNNNFGMQIPLLEITNNVLLPLVGISLFYYGLLTEQTVVSKLLSSKLFLLLGKSSYVFYLIQAGIIELFFSRFTHNHMLVFLPLVIVSILIYRFLEEPMNLYIRKRFTSNKK